MPVQLVVVAGFIAALAVCALPAAASGAGWAGRVATVEFGEIGSPRGTFLGGAVVAR
jgi:hypothetical protein